VNKKTERFLDTYKKLEATVSAQYALSDSDSAVGFLERRAEFRSIKKELAYCREVRNLLTHNPKIDGRYAVEPSDAMIALLDRTISRVTNPQRAKHIWVPVAQVVCAQQEDLVRPAMVSMYEKSYTHIPIVKNGIVTGAFSENTLLTCLVEDEIISIGKNTRFSHIARFLALDKHRTESFYFIGKEMPVSQIQDLFAKADQAGERIGLLFVTENGKQTEKLLGILTAWDIAGAE